MDVTTTDKTPNLSWTLTNGGITIDSYDVYLGTDSLSPPLIGNTASTTFTPSSNLATDAGTRYYWYVVGNINGGGTTASSIESFILAESAQGSELVIPNLIITNNTSTNEVVKIKTDNQLVSTYAANDPILGSNSITNGCLINGEGFADLGTVTGNIFSGDGYTRRHNYSFTFTNNQTVDYFKIHVTDWADLLPFGVNVDQTYWMELQGFDINNNLVDQDRFQFTSSGSEVTGRISNEFGSHSIAGDGCFASLGQPGNMDLEVQGSGIYRVELHFRDLPSEDPNIGLSIPVFTIEETPPSPTPTITASAVPSPGPTTTISPILPKTGMNDADTELVLSTMTIGLLSIFVYKVLKWEIVSEKKRLAR